MRTNFKLGLWLLVGSAVLGSGCSSDRRRGSVPADPLATRAGFCEEWGKRACTAPVVQACLAVDAASCAAKQADYCLQTLPSGYASDNAKACLDAVASAYADDRLTAEEHEVVIGKQGTFGAPCDKLIEGPGVSGSPCSTTIECNTLDDLVCVFRPGQTGTCQVPVVQGGGRSCVEAFQLCEEGFYCNGQNCVEGRFEGQACSAQEPCGADVNCAGPEGGAKTCVAKGQDRTPCTSDDDCVSKICARSGSSGVCAPEIRLAPADPLCENLR